MQDTRTTYRRTSTEGMYEVYAGETHVGNVMRSWSRTHGWGWRAMYHSGRSADYHTRRDAGAAVARDGR